MIPQIERLNLAPSLSVLEVGLEAGVAGPSWDATLVHIYRDEQRDDSNYTGAGQTLHLFTAEGGKRGVEKRRVPSTDLASGL